MSTYIGQLIPRHEANSVKLPRQSRVDYMKKEAKTCIKKKNFNESEISNLPGKKLMVIKMFTELGRIYEHRENFNRDEKYKHNK